jgi:integrase
MAIINKGDRKYLVIIHLGYDGQKRKTRSKRVNLQYLSNKEAEKQIIIIEKEFEDEVKGNPNNDASMKFKEFTDMFLNDYAVQQLRPKTIASYKFELEKRILPEFGYMKINDIRPTQLIKYYSKLSKRTYKRGNDDVLLSNRTVKYSHQILSSIFGQAVKWQVIKENPCKYVSPPKANTSKKVTNYWEDYHAIKFLEAIGSEKLKYICATELALIGGLRTEEILGLDINDITETGVIIRRTSKLVDGSGMVIEEVAKNESSERSVTLPQPVITNLRKLKLEQMASQFELQNKWEDITIGKKPRVMLFTQDKGKPMYGKTFNSWLKKFVKSYNKGKEEKLPEITFHGLRHTNASLMIYLGVDARTGAARMGHAQTSTFLNIYGHMLERADKEIANKLESTLLKKV